MVTKVGSARGVPRVIHRLGAERTFVPMALCVDLCGGATGQVETTWETGGPGTGWRPRLFHNNTLNEILVFDLSLATGLYALTIYAGTVIGTRRRGISRSLRDVSD